MQPDYEIMLADSKATKLIEQQTEPTTLEATMTRAQLFKAGNPNWTIDLDYREVKIILLLFSKAQKYGTEDMFYAKFDNYLAQERDAMTAAYNVLQLSKRI